MTTYLARILVLAIAAASLAACVAEPSPYYAYGPDAGYYSQTYVYQPPPVVVGVAPIYYGGHYWR